MENIFKYDFTCETRGGEKICRLILNVQSCFMKVTIFFECFDDQISQLKTFCNILISDSPEKCVVTGNRSHSATQSVTQSATQSSTHSASTGSHPYCYFTINTNSSNIQIHTETGKECANIIHIPKKQFYPAAIRILELLKQKNF